MYWLARPPMLRWLAAGALLTGAAALDFREARTSPFPFAAVAVASGAEVGPDLVEWRDVPDGLLGEPAALDGYAAHPIMAGSPLTVGTVTSDTPIQPTWWSVPMTVPPDTAAGTRVRIVASQPPIDVEGVITRPATEGAFGVSSPGMVAVPPESARAVAEGAATGTLIVLVGS